jgi:hypothetical protein
VSEHIAESGARCWRSECRSGCYYPDVCSERPTGEKDAFVVTSVNGEQMLATPAAVDGTPGWMSVEGEWPQQFWGWRYIASATRVTSPAVTPAASGTETEETGA